MAVRRLTRHGPSKAPAHRLFLTTTLTLIFVTAAALILLFKGTDPVIHSVDIDKTQVELRAYVSRTIQSLKPDEDPERTKVEALFRQAREQIAVAHAYGIYARQAKLEVVKLLKNFTDHANVIKNFLSQPQIRALQDESTAADQEALKMFEKELREQLKLTRQLMMDSKEIVDIQVKVQKLRDTMFTVNDQWTKAKKHGELSNLIAARSTPKSLHCLSMRLLEDRISNEHKYEDVANPAPELHDPSLYHYVILSDNVLATSVVLNSVVQNCRYPEKHVFHIITDKMNLWTMKVWFTMQPPNNVSHIEVTSFDDFSFLKESYVPLLQQLKANEQWKNLEHHLMLKHLRFYLPELFPKLRKIVFLDDDVVVQKDLTPLFGMNMDGKVHAAVEICSASFNRYSHYLNFSHPLIKKKFDPNACAWAYGMNLFDLNAWRKQQCTEEYHHWQIQNENQTIWKMGTFPPGLITFYKNTKALDRSWHALGLGSNPNISIEKIRKAAVIHYSGHMKPWLDIALNQYRDHWTKYVDYNMPLIQICNIGH